MSFVSHFSFIDEPILRENLDISFNHLVELLSVSESDEYDDVSKSSFRKTIIIYTASIIEALLMWILKNKKSSEELDKKYPDIKITKSIYKINEAEEIILVKHVVKIEKCKFEKLNLDQIKGLCTDHGLITHAMSQNVNKVRQLRNRLHISTLSRVEKDYSKDDLEFVFSVAAEVKKIAKGT